MDDYERLHGKLVGLVVDAFTVPYYRSNEASATSLQIEGTLKEETGLQIVLRNARTITEYEGKPAFKTDELYVNKNKIVLLYLIPEQE